MTDHLDMRKTYDRDSLDEAKAALDPFTQFEAWFGEALTATDLLEPHAMTVATVDPDGQPSARIVLLRGWDERGFAFYTNYDSRKGHDIAANGRAAILFYWNALERQVRIEGQIEKLPVAESDAYFARRPRGNRLSAWASPQSAVVANRAVLDDAMKAADEQFAGVEVPRPDYWGGYRVSPARIEFWQGRPNRVHDRLRYACDGTGWTRERLAP